MESAGVDNRQSLSALPPDGGPSRQDVEDGEMGDTCRICRGEATSEQPLFYPCKCSGSIKYVHQECLMEWLSHSQKKWCELCKTRFRFTKLYDQSMPDALPVPLFLRQIVLYGARTLGRWLRYVAVIFIWTCCLPWVIRQVWRGLFWLADGRWMSENELHDLLASQAVMSLGNHTTNATLPMLTAATQTLSLPTFSPVAFLVSIITGDALLRGLLRLVTIRLFTFVPSTASANGTNIAYGVEPLKVRHPSILSEVESLSSFTKHKAINNAIIDILEGQLVCLSVIAAFILVFLIREWVINQQPVHMMPDPDQADVPAAQGPDDDEARQVARRRRLNVRRPPEQDGQPENAALDIGLRPLAVPRARRAVLVENPVAVPEPERAELVSNVSSGPDTVSHIQSVDGDREQANTQPQLTDVQESTWLPVDLQAPPLQRGIFDEAADIRRNIEEHTELQLENDLTNFSHGVSSVSEVVIGHANHQTNPEAGNLPDFTALPRRSSSLKVTPASSTSSVAHEVPDTQLDHHVSPPSSLVNEPNKLETTGSASTAFDGPTPPPSISSHSSETDSNEVELEIAPIVEIVNDEIVDESAEYTSFMDTIAGWLWPTEHINSMPAVPSTAGAQLREALDAENGTAHIDRAGVNLEPLQEPIPHAPPAREPNVQFGADANEANVLDDAEDLEGVLELIGMEGPIAGMIQNIIFSVFLIALTLSASVWCPYIWGKIALLVMTNPVGVFFKAPLFFLSRVADFLVDLALLFMGLLGLVLASLTRSTKVFVRLLLPEVAKRIKISTAESFAANVTQSSTARLEKVLSLTVFHLRPDLPTFSMQSHYALRVFKGAFFDAATAIQEDLLNTWTKSEILWQAWGLKALPLVIIQELATFPGAIISAAPRIVAWFTKLSNDLVMPAIDQSNAVDMSLIDWSTKDKILTTILGYAFFAISGGAYLKLARFFMSLKDDQKVEGVFADGLRQASGVMKVIIIIGIEMIAFPLYCGWLLDIALLPLFGNATLGGRLTFLANAPITGVFVHWFIGTCYMFHFALFVSMCRKIMRKGVLYFIRDPDDPNFHPVRDVLERTVFTQLSKIAFSACVYGILLLLCLGGVIWTLSRFEGIFPIQWAAVEPRLAFPADVVFFNFLLPFFIKSTEPSKKISSVYAWWFSLCARYLRLSHFLFGKVHEDEIRAVYWTSDQFSIESVVRTSTENEASASSEPVLAPLAGRWVRAPASDAVRIPKGSKVFLEVNADNERVDGLTDKDLGLHGKNDDRFEKVFIPFNFRLRIGAFVFLVWLFAAATGLLCTLAPLTIGRFTLGILSGSHTAPNDLYALTIGLHLGGGLLMLVVFLQNNFHALKQTGVDIASNLMVVMSHAMLKVQEGLGFLYLGVVFGVIIPLLLSLLAELYVHMPLYEFLVYSTQSASKATQASPSSLHQQSQTSPSPTIYLVQSWTLGIVYLRLLIRACLRYENGQTRLATTIRSVAQHGFLRPKISLASRGILLPLVVLTATLLLVPLGLAKACISASGSSHGTAMAFYRHSYPIILLISISIYATLQLKRKVEGWRVRVRDEVYLVGERLHNFVDESSIRALRKPTLKQDKGKDRERATEGGTNPSLMQHDAGNSSSVSVEDPAPYRRGRIDTGDDIPAAASGTQLPV